MPDSRLCLPAVLAALALGLTGCADDDAPVASGTGAAPTATAGAGADDGDALGFPLFATKNTTRVAGADPVADAAGVAQAVFPGQGQGLRPTAVVLADARDWRAALAASVLTGPPVNAPVLLTDDDDTMPAATAAALKALSPTGSDDLGGAQVIRVGSVPRTPGLRSTDLRAADAFAMARAIDALQAATMKTAGDRVLVVGSEDPAFAMPAAAWAAKSGEPIMFVKRDEVPGDTRAALRAHGRSDIYVLGPSATVSGRVVRELRRFGTVKRIEGPTPVENAIAFARYQDGAFGWGIIDPGHGLVFARADADPATAAAASALSSAGSYGPLLLLDGPDRAPRALTSFMLDIQPGYAADGGDPVRGVYNRGWIVGDARAISPGLQARLDRMLEIVPVSQEDQP